MSAGDNLEPIRGFVRNLNVVTKQANLYGLKHKRVEPQVDATWKDLRAALESGKLVLTAAVDKLLVGGKPLQAGSAEKSLAQLLTSAGVAGICFFPEITFEQLLAVIATLGGTKPSELQDRFSEQFGKSGPVKLLGFQVEDGGGTSSPGVADQLAAVIVGSSVEGTAGTIADPVALLKLLCASSPANAKELGASGVAVPEVGEQELTETIRWLAKLGTKKDEGSDKPTPKLDELSVPAQSLLRLSLAAADRSRESDEKGLVGLAEHLALKLALEKYEKGEIPLNAAHQLLQRMKKEIGALRGLVEAQKGALARAGLDAAEEIQEDLDKQFWARVPARNKLQVLLSPDAWVIPAHNVATFVEDLLSQSNVTTAEQLLRNYCEVLRTSPNRQAKASVAKGIGELADCFVRISPRLLHWVMGLANSALQTELNSELNLVLCRSLGKLARAAASWQDYAGVCNYFDHLTALETASPETSERIRSVAQVEDIVSRFVDDAITASVVPHDLLEALQQMPEAVAGELRHRARRCNRRDEYRKLGSLTEAVGTPLLKDLRRTAEQDKAEEALPAVGLLAPLDQGFVETTLKKRLPSWSLPEQCMAIHQIACSGVPERGVLLAGLFNSFDELVLPQAIDEIGASGRTKVNALLKVIAEENAASQFIQLKVIEALGNLKAAAAVPVLRDMVLARNLVMWKLPREMRIVALQALIKIDVAIGRHTAARSGITQEELQFAPLNPTNTDWVRHRRYARVPIDGKMWVAIRSGKGACDVTVEALSLGGGGGRTHARVQVEPYGEAEFQIGIRKIRARVLLHPEDSHKMGFEFASIPLEDRSRLRQFLTARCRA